MRRSVATSLLIIFAISTLFSTAQRAKYNFNPDWLLFVGDISGAEAPEFNDKTWKQVNLPSAFNEDEAFKVDIHDHTDTVMWYRKHFSLDDFDYKKAFVEFEGVRFGGDIYINGHHLGIHENGVMAFGFDLTPYLKEGDNVIAARIDNDWNYRERATGQKYQWDNANFNANYGGIPKNVYLHLTDADVYQTLPLYSNLGTTGTYVYGTDYDIPGRSVVVHAESEVKNDGTTPRLLGYRVTLKDADGNTVKTFEGKKRAVAPGQTMILKADAPVDSINFWSWGYGYLYDVVTELVDEQGHTFDPMTTRTGFRKTKFGDGKFWLNDRVMQVKGYAQRTSNEWPALGMSVPAWLSDYSNNLMVQSGGNLVRWMHVTPWKQDVESCDRVGLIQAMPAGDAEKDCQGRQWEQRKALMRDAIIYNRNNPSIVFYESGNESISRDHMVEMIAIRDMYDPEGGRAVGSREMLDIDEAEYGGEMLYINKSMKHPMWAMEYCRDEALRKYWDDYSYPFHKHGEGNTDYHSTVTNSKGKKVDATAYNQNQDLFTVELVRRWYDYWRERPGTGTRSSSGGAKIIFSDSNTHFRGVENYRRSGVTDAMRIPKDGYFAHQVMWHGWVDTDEYQTYIIGHWTYPDSTVKPVYVVSNGEDVELLLNGKSLGHGKRDYNFLFSFPEVAYEPGTLEAVSYDTDGKELSRHSLSTAGKPARLLLTKIENPEGFHSDGSDVAILQFEVVDKNGNRCPVDNREVSFTIEGEGEWRGGIAQGPDNYILNTTLPVECGVNRAVIRSTRTPGDIKVTAKADGLPKVSTVFTTLPVEVNAGLSDYMPSTTLAGRFDKGPTPLTPSYKDTKRGVKIVAARAGTNEETAINSYDDNELSEWRNDGHLSTAWIEYTLEREALIDDICVKFTGWRQRSYPIEVYAADKLIWSGDTDRSLGYVHLNLSEPVSTDRISFRLKGAARTSDAFGQIVEVVEPKAGELDLFKAEGGDKTNSELRIVEVEFLESI